MTRLRSHRVAVVGVSVLLRDIGLLLDRGNVIFPIDGHAVVCIHQAPDADESFAAVRRAGSCNDIHEGNVALDSLVSSIDLLLAVIGAVDIRFAVCPGSSDRGNLEVNVAVLRIGRLTANRADTVCAAGSIRFFAVRALAVGLVAAGVGANENVTAGHGLGRDAFCHNGRAVFVLQIIGFSELALFEGTDDPLVTGRFLDRAAIGADRSDLFGRNGLEVARKFGITSSVLLIAELLSHISHVLGLCICADESGISFADDHRGLAIQTDGVEVVRGLANLFILRIIAGRALIVVVAFLFAGGCRRGSAIQHPGMIDGFDVMSGIADVVDNDVDVAVCVAALECINSVAFEIDKVRVDHANVALGHVVTGSRDIHSLFRTAALANSLEHAGGLAGRSRHGRPTVCLSSTDVRILMLADNEFAIVLNLVGIGINNGTVEGIRRIVVGAIGVTKSGNTGIVVKVLVAAEGAFILIPSTLHAGRFMEGDVVIVSRLVRFVGLTGLAASCTSFKRVTACNTVRLNDFGHFPLVRTGSGDNISIFGIATFRAGEGSIAVSGAGRSYDGALIPLMTGRGDSLLIEGTAVRALIDIDAGAGASGRDALVGAMLEVMADGRDLIVLLGLAADRALIEGIAFHGAGRSHGLALFDPSMAGRLDGFGADLTAGTFESFEALRGAGRLDRDGAFAPIVGMLFLTGRKQEGGGTEEEQRDQRYEELQELSG